jgi:inositol 1,4,5-triphosphate receptor type 3
MIHIYVLDSFLFNEEIYLLNFMILMSILGIITHYNLFYFVLQLLVVINFVDTIKEIVIAFQIRFSQLFCMIGFLAILIFFFSNIGFFFYIDEFDAQINGKTENYCQTLLECAITYFNHGVRAGGGIGDILPEKDFIDMNSYTIRWTTDLIFYITVILLLLNMINGVIVSTFSQIRETSSQKEEDIEERCFICNKEKKDFEKKKIDFSNHCETEHNLYDYIMFFVMLKRIEEKDLDSDQTYINEKLDEKDIAFFPVGYAKGFEDEEDEEEKEDEDEKDDEDEL